MEMKKGTEPKTTAAPYYPIRSATSAKMPATGAPYPTPRIREPAALAVPVVDAPAPEPVADDDAPLPPAAAPAVVPFPPVLVPSAERGTAVIVVHVALLLSCPS